MKRKPLYVITFLALALVAALGFHWTWSNRPPRLLLPGTVEVQEVRLASKTGGRIEEVLTAEGDLVEPGQVLVRLQAPELEAQLQQWRGRWQAAEAEYQKAMVGAREEEKTAAAAATAAAQARLQRLKAGNRPEEIAQAQRDADAAQADWRLAQQKFERVRRLATPVYAAQEDYDVANATLKHTQAKYQAAKAHLDLLEAGSRVEDVAEAEAEWRRVQANEELLRAGTRAEDLSAAAARVQEMQGKLQEMQAMLKEAEIRAPERAVVEVLAVRKGDVVAPNQPLVRILRADDLWVKVYIPETQLSRIRLGQTVTVHVDGYPDRHFTGTIRQIAGISEFTPRNVQSVDERRHQVFGVKVQVTDPEGVFKSGMAAEVEVPLQ